MCRVPDLFQKVLELYPVVCLPSSVSPIGTLCVRFPVWAERGAKGRKSDGMAKYNSDGGHAVGISYLWGI